MTKPSGVGNVTVEGGPRGPRWKREGNGMWVIFTAGSDGYLTAELYETREAAAAAFAEVVREAQEEDPGDTFSMPAYGNGGAERVETSRETVYMVEAMGGFDA